MRLYNILAENVGSTQKAIPLKKYAPKEDYRYIPSRNQVQFSDAKNQLKNVGPITQLVQSKINPTWINAVVQYQDRHINLGLSIRNDPASFIAALEKSSYPIKYALYDAAAKKYAIKTNAAATPSTGATAAQTPDIMAYYERHVKPKLQRLLPDSLKTEIITQINSLSSLAKKIRALTEALKAHQKPINEEEEKYLLTAINPLSGNKEDTYVVHAISKTDALNRLKNANPNLIKIKIRSVKPLYRYEIWAYDPEQDRRRRYFVTASDQEEATRKFKQNNPELKNMKVTSEITHGYYEKWTPFQRIMKGLTKTPKYLENYKRKNQELGDLQIAMAEEATELLNHTLAPLNIKSLSAINKAYGKATVNRLKQFIDSLKVLKIILYVIGTMNRRAGTLNQELKQALHKTDDESILDVSQLLKDYASIITSYNFD